MQYGLIERVASELEVIRCEENITCSSTSPCTTRRRGYYNDIGVTFPNACLQYLQSIPGNQHCVDCGSPNPTWASITYGVVLCLQCSGVHRSYGVQISYVRSIQYDTWDAAQILSLLEGGNTQLRTFFLRHQLLAVATGTGSNGISPSVEPSQQLLYNQRYHTKAAQFYKVHLKQHVQTVTHHGVYQGREHNRNRSSSSAPEKPSHRSTSPSSVVIAQHHHKPTRTTTVCISPCTSSLLLLDMHNRNPDNNNNNNSGTVITEVAIQFA